MDKAGGREEGEGGGGIRCNRLDPGSDPPMMVEGEVEVQAFTVARGLDVELGGLAWLCLVGCFGELGANFGDLFSRSFAAGGARVE